MSNRLKVDLILERQNFPGIYYATYLISFIILLAIILLFTIKYETYYITKGKMVDSELCIIVKPEDIKFINNKHYLIIEDKEYVYRIDKISNELYVDDNYVNYQYVFLTIYKLSNIDNYVYEVRIPKEKKILAKYLKDYLLKGGEKWN